MVPLKSSLCQDVLEFWKKLSCSYSLEDSSQLIKIEALKPVFRKNKSFPYFVNVLKRKENHVF